MKVKRNIGEVSALTQIAMQVGLRSPGVIHFRPQLSRPPRPSSSSLFSNPSITRILKRRSSFMKPTACSLAKRRSLNWSLETERRKMRIPILYSMKSTSSGRRQSKTRKEAVEFIKHSLKEEVEKLCNVLDNFREYMMQVEDAVNALNTSEHEFLTPL